MKLLVNKCEKTIILNPGGRQVELRPSGMPRDRKEVTDKFAEHPDVLKFVARGWLEVLSTTEAALREASEAKQKEAVAPSQAPAPSAPAAKPAEPEVLPSAVVPAFDHKPFSINLAPEGGEQKSEGKAEDKAVEDPRPSRRRR